MNKTLLELAQTNVPLVLMLKIDLSNGRVVNKDNSLSDLT